MSKVLKYDSNARESILKGVLKLEKAVASTLGPRGRTVLIDEGYGVHVTKDGVTVAEHIDLKDPYENVGVKVIKEVAAKTNSMVGDGTTTSTVLAASIYENGLKHVTMGANAVMIKNGLERAADSVVDAIRSRAKKISTSEEICQVATVSANGDTSIGKTIADVMSKIGNDGTIKVEDGNTTTMTSKIVEGMQFERGWISPYFVTNDKMEADLDKPFVLIADKKLSNVQELLGLLQCVAKAARPLLIIADDVDGEALSLLVVNKLRGLQVCAVRSPSYGDNRKAILNDIAILTGGKVISDQTGVTIESAISDPSVLGNANRIVVSKDSTTIIDGKADKELLQARIAELRSLIEQTDQEFEANLLRERLAKLAAGVGIIQVGALTEAELKEKKDRVDDAFNATKAAVKEGIVAGGGVALLMAKQELEKTTFLEMTSDEMIGVNILCQSLESPIRKILENAGIDSSLIVAKLLDDKTGNNVGYDVLTKQFVNMIDAGIIDPCLVTVSAVKNAVSVAGLLLTTNCMVVEEKVEQPAPQVQMPPVGMM